MEFSKELKPLARKYKDTLVEYTRDLIGFCQRQKGNMSAQKNASLKEEFVIWEMRVLQSLESLRKDLDVQQ